MLPPSVFSRGEPEDFSHERWVHFRAVEETFLFHSEETLVRLALFWSISRNRNSYLSLAHTRTHTHTRCYKFPHTKAVVHPSTRSTAGMFHRSPDSELCSRSPSPHSSLSAGHGHTKGRRQWSALINNTSTELKIMNKSWTERTQSSGHTHTHTQTHTHQSDLLLRPGRMNRQKKRTKQGL